MDADKLKGMGLTPTQIDQVLTEHNRAVGGGRNAVTSEKLEARQKRDEIMAIEDTKIRQELITKNRDLFVRQEGS